MAITTHEELIAFTQYSDELLAALNAYLKIPEGQADAFDDEDEEEPEAPDYSLYNEDEEAF